MYDNLLIHNITRKLKNIKTCYIIFWKIEIVMRGREEYDYPQ